MLYRLRNIAKTYKGRTVLDIPALTIESGKIYTLIGPNGAGKTTLLNLLAFLDQPTSGSLYFRSKNEVDYSRKSLLGLRRKVVLLDQHPILFTGSVYKNVEYGLKVRGISPPERMRRVQEMLELVGMEKFINADAHKLSGGETKRVALARALAFGPEVLLCDEPAANVDRENQEILLSILAKINDVDKTSILFSTHYLSQGRKLADHTLMLEHGRLSDVMSENIFRVNVIRREQKRVLCRLAGHMVSLPEHLVAGDLESFKLYIDPEQIHYQVVSGGKSTSASLTGHVIQVNQDRGRVQVAIDLGVILYCFISLEEYQKAPPHISSKVLIDLPDSCFSCTPV